MPFLWLEVRAVLGLKSGDDGAQFSVHHVAASVLVDSVLDRGVRRRSNTALFDVVGYYVIVELSRDQLHPQLLLIAQEAYDLVENVE